MLASPALVLQRDRSSSRLLTLRESEEMTDWSMVAQRHDVRVDVEHGQPGSGIKITTTLHRQVPYEPARMGTHVTSLGAITDRSRIEVHAPQPGVETIKVRGVRGLEAGGDAGEVLRVQIKDAPSCGSQLVGVQQGRFVGRHCL